MEIFYKEGFFNNDFGGFVPEGAVEITPEEYEALLIGQAEGKRIVANSQGKPILIEPAPSPQHEWNGTAWVISPEKQAVQFEQKKAELLRTIAEKTDRLKSRYLQGYSQAEIDSFYRQEREARGELAPLLLTELFEGRDDLTDIEQLKAKVIKKAELFAIIMGAIFAKKQHFEQAIERATSLEALAKIESEIEQWQK